MTVSLILSYPVLCRREHREAVARFEAERLRKQQQQEQRERAQREQQLAERQRTLQSEFDRALTSFKLGLPIPQANKNKPPAQTADQHPAAEFDLNSKVAGFFGVGSQPQWQSQPKPDSNTNAGTA